MTGPVAILGGRGMLGTDLAAQCSRSGLATAVFDLPEFDITKAVDIRRAIGGTSAVVNCAAYTNVEKAEAEPELAAKINAEAVGLLGEAARQAGVPVLHISTDFVFDGRLDRPYAETDPANPVSAYGRTKYQGELALAQSGCRHCIIRVQWTYGRAGVNFVRKIIDAARSGKPLKVVSDQIGSPTATVEAAKAIVALLQLPSGLPEGLFHFAAAEYVSRFDMARHIVERLRLAVVPQPCKTSDFVTAAQRPLNSRFDCRKIARVLPEPIAEWPGPLNAYLESL
jgi:dTDP-4-dehydrorhamnose reductase